MIDVIVPLEQEGTQAVVRTWLRQVGDRVEVNDPLCELETDKVAVEVPAPAAGVLREILLQSNDEAAPGAVLGRIAAVVEVAEQEAEPVGSQPILGTPVPGPEPRPSTSLGASEVRNPELRLSPAVKRACLQHNLDPKQIQGTGRDGRITRADVDRFVEAGGKAKSPAHAPSDAAIASHSIPHDRMRLRIAENMLNSVTQAPHVTAMFEADFTSIMRHRARHKDAWARQGV